MNWIVLVLVACMNDSCQVVEAEASMVDQEREQALHERCEKAANCIEPRRGIFIVRQAPKSPGPIPRTPQSPARVPGGRA